MMDVKKIKTCIKELYGINETGEKKREVSILETALFVEDVFDITLTDREICTENLGDFNNLISLVQKKRRD
jgi:copper chaperone CopZ